MRTASLAALAFVVISGCSGSHGPPRVDRLDCAGCHLDLYDSRATEHLVRQVPAADTRCYACHGTAAWFPNRSSPSIDDVPRGNRHLSTADGRRIFSIEEKKHAGFDCFECHVDCAPDCSNADLVTRVNADGDPLPHEFLCATCHEHSAARTDPLHDDEDGYVHESNACFDCHPRGEGEDEDEDEEDHD
jgi:hypothetical protein